MFGKCCTTDIWCLICSQEKGQADCACFQQKSASVVLRVDCRRPSDDVHQTFATSAIARSNNDGWTTTPSEIWQSSRKQSTVCVHWATQQFSNELWNVHIDDVPRINSMGKWVHYKFLQLTGHRSRWCRHHSGTAQKKIFCHGAGAWISLDLCYAGPHRQNGHYNTMLCSVLITSLLFWTSPPVIKV